MTGEFGMRRARITIVHGMHSEIVAIILVICILGLISMRNKLVVFVAVE